MSNSSDGIAGGFILLWFAIVIFFLIGWVMNIVKLCKCDFDRPYKAEVIRAVGAAVPPVGGIVGWMDLGK